MQQQLRPPTMQRPRFPAAQQPAVPSLPARAPVPLLSGPAARRGPRCVVTRFKEGDEERELIERRRRQEDVIRAQEEELKEAQQEAGGAGPARRDDAALRDAQRAALVKSMANGSFLPGVVGTKGGLKGYADAALRVPALFPAFTRRRELFIGRAAMVGFAGVCAVEALTSAHLGVLSQVEMWTGLEPAAIHAVVGSLAGYYLVGGLGPWSTTFTPENLMDVARRPEGPPTKLVSPLDLGHFLGISGWGFTKRNEIFHGRLAMLAWIWAYLGEMATGMGPLAQLAVNLGLTPNDDFYSLVGKVFGGFVVTALLLSLPGLPGTGSKYQADPEFEIY